MMPVSGRETRSNTYMAGKPRPGEFTDRFIPLDRAEEHGPREDLGSGRPGPRLASEAVAAVRDYGFGTLCFPRIIAIIDPANVASIRVASKLGMQHEKAAAFQGKAVHIHGTF